MKRALVIDPAKQTVEAVEKEWTLSECQEAVGGYIENGSAEPKVVLYVDEEGLLKNPEHFFMVAGITSTPMAGRGILMMDAPDGETGSVPEGLEKIIWEGVHYFDRRTVAFLAGLFGW